MNDTNLLLCLPYLLTTPTSYNIGASLSEPQHDQYYIMTNRLNVAIYSYRFVELSVNLILHMRNNSHVWMVACLVLFPDPSLVPRPKHPRRVWWHLNAFLVMCTIMWSSFRLRIMWNACTGIGSFPYPRAFVHILCCANSAVTWPDPCTGATSTKQWASLMIN